MRPSLVFVDIGRGDGFFALPAARLVGGKGIVYGLDINETAISRLRENAAGENLKNIRLRVGKAEETVLCEGCADIVFFSIVLHDFEDPAKVLTNARRMLKPTGRLVDIDWKKKPMELGPPLQVRFSEEDAASRIRAAGFTIEVEGRAASTTT